MIAPRRFNGRLKEGARGPPSKTWRIGLLPRQKPRVFPRFRSFSSPPNCWRLGYRFGGLGRPTARCCWGRRVGVETRKSSAAASSWRPKSDKAWASDSSHDSRSLTGRAFRARLEEPLMAHPVGAGAGPRSAGIAHGADAEAVQLSGDAGALQGQIHDDAVPGRADRIGAAVRQKNGGASRRARAGRAPVRP